jgi:hypothetical protein
MDRIIVIHICLPVKRRKLRSIADALILVGLKVHNGSNLCRCHCKATGNLHLWEMFGKQPWKSMKIHGNPWYTTTNYLHPFRFWQFWTSHEHFSNECLRSTSRKASSCDAMEESLEPTLTSLALQYLQCVFSLHVIISLCLLSCSFVTYQAGKRVWLCSFHK